MWQPITEEEVLTRLSEPERHALETVAVGWTQENPIADIIAMVCDEWRAALRLRFRIGPAGTVPSELRIHILADIRYRILTRLPGMTALLDERRVKEYEDARAVLSHLDRYLVEEPPAEASAASNPRAGVRVVSKTQRRFTRHTLKGL